MAGPHSAAARARAAAVAPQDAPSLMAKLVDSGPLDRPMSWMARQAARLLPRREPISAGWLIVIVTLGRGLWILLPWSTQATPTYQWLEAAAAEWAWGLLAVGIAAAGAFGLRSYPAREFRMLRRRRIGMTACGAWNIFLGLSFLMARPSSTGGPTYLVLGFWALVHAMWLRVEAGHRSDLSTGG